MKTCCVDGCNGPDTPNPIYFELPSRRLLRKRWLDAINCPEAADDATVCIRHFTREDYELVRGKATLRSRSVPTLRIVESEDEDSDSESDSSESTTSDRTQDKTNKTDDTGTHNDNGDNGTINNDNGNNDKTAHNDNTDNGKINHDHGKDNENSDSDSQMENGHTEEDKSCSQKVNIENSDNGLYNKDNGKTNDENRNVNDDNGNINDGNGKVNDDHGKVSNEHGKVTHDHGKVTNDHGKVTDDHGKVTNDHGKVNDDHRKVNDDHRKVNDDHRKVNDDNGKVNDDNGKVNNDNGNNKKPQGRKTRCKITALRPINGRRKPSFSSDSSNSDSVSSSPRLPEVEGSKEDIEESLQHYYIENKKTERQIAAMTDVINEEQEKKSDGSGKYESEAFGATEPVFIELSVGQESTTEGPTESDCLMVLESVQCDVDPALLLAAREEDEQNMEQVDLDDDEDEDEPEFIPKKKEDPISLLTSSDEDDVILQEPKYDTVEVSSADTSEDDMPLVKLVKSSMSSQPDAKKRKLSAKHTKNLITKLLWGRNDFYCVHCSFTTANASDYTKHMATHNLPESQHKIIQYCQECGFTTSSKHQMQKHKQKHKNEKRFKCPKCNYSAKHEMSLVYHMKTHNSSLNEVELAICGTYDPTSEKSERSKKSEKSKKSKSSDRSKLSDSVKKYSCAACGYKTDRRSDLKRHRRRKHDNDDDDDDDDEYVP